MFEKALYLKNVQNLKSEIQRQRTTSFQTALTKVYQGSATKLFTVSF